MRKKLLALVLALALCLSLCACGGESPETAGTPVPTAEPTPFPLDWENVTGLN